MQIGNGLRAFQVRSYSVAQHRDGPPPRAFYAVRKDGSAEDFSYLKCIDRLFPGACVRCPAARRMHACMHGTGRRHACTSTPGNGVRCACPTWPDAGRPWAASPRWRSAGLSLDLKSAPQRVMMQCAAPLTLFLLGWGKGFRGFRGAVVATAAACTCVCIRRVPPLMAAGGTPPTHPGLTLSRASCAWRLLWPASACRRP